MGNRSAGASPASRLDEADLGVDALYPTVAKAMLEGGIDERGYPPDAAGDSHHGL